MAIKYIVKAASLASADTPIRLEPRGLARDDGKLKTRRRDRCHKMMKGRCHIDYLETCIEKINQEYPAALIIVAGDMSNEDIIQRTGLTQIVNQTRVELIYLTASARIYQSGYIYWL